MSVLELNGRIFDASTTGTLTLTGEGGAATTDVTQGLSKAWGRFDGSAGTISYTSNLNCSGLTDNATSDYSSAMTNNMSDGTYIIIGTAGKNTTSERNFVIPSNDFAPTASAFRMQVTTADGTLASDQATYIAFDVKGDLA